MLSDETLKELIHLLINNIPKVQINRALIAIELGIDRVANSARDAGSTEIYEAILEELIELIKET